MLNNKQKLELTWIGKNNPEYDIANIEPRILEENPELSNCTNDPNTENMIIHGDNLLALKALLPEYEGKVKCIYIDPPYNTGNAFEHYDDSVEHSTWLSLMKPRLMLLRELMKEDGFIFISIDDNELYYLKVLFDEVFGRQNFISNLIWKKKRKASNLDKFVRQIHEYILVYAKNKKYTNKGLSSSLDVVEADKPYPFYNTGNKRAILNFPGSFVSTGQLADGVYPLGEYRDGKSVVRLLDDVTVSGGVIINQFRIEGEWRYSQKRLNQLVSDNQTVIIKGKKFKPYWINNSDRVKYIKTLLNEYENIGTNEDAEKEIFNIFQSKAFKYPKPESLLSFLVESACSRGDIVLDSFLGSGTTAAVAHKMNRKYIGIEMGDHAYTHCKVRLDKVIDGSDQGGISKSVNWQGGGAYKFYELAPSFITKDEFGNSVIDEYYNDTKLIKAMCKLMNFTYKPSQTEYWKHGIGQGRSYIYVTTQFLTAPFLKQIKSHLQPGETLMVCAKQYEPDCLAVDPQIAVKKIPQSVLKACHYGKKDYLLPIKEDKAIEELEEEINE